MSLPRATVSQWWTLILGRDGDVSGSRAVLVPQGHQKLWRRDARHRLASESAQPLTGRTWGCGADGSVADFNIRMTVWSLVNKSCTYIKAPKFAGKGVSFSPDGKFMALAERRECKDYVSVFSTSAWTVAAHFQVETNDLSDLAWSPDGGAIAVWDHALEYKLLVYAADGRKLAQHAAYEHALGIKGGSVAWSPSGQLLAVGSYDQVSVAYAVPRFSAVMFEDESR
jgi:hypothetical protein